MFCNGKVFLIYFLLWQKLTSFFNSKIILRTLPRGVGISSFNSSNASSSSTTGSLTNQKPQNSSSQSRSSSAEPFRSHSSLSRSASNDTFRHESKILFCLIKFKSSKTGYSCYCPNSTTHYAIYNISYSQALSFILVDILSF